MNEIFPEMDQDSLKRWALKHGVSHALQIPAKLLQSRTSGSHASWLWVHRQNNTPILEIITRQSARSPKEINASRAPIEFQRAAISYLQDAIQEQHQALQDEENLLRLSPPTEPELLRLWNRLQDYRRKLRNTHRPRTKKERHTQGAKQSEDRVITLCNCPLPHPTTPPLQNFG